jgi:hypothetical protein
MLVVELLVEVLSVRDDAAVLDAFTSAALAHPEAAIRVSALDAIEKVAARGTALVAPVIACISNTDSSIRDAAVKAIPHLGEPAVQPLIDIFDDARNRADARIAALSAIEKLGPTAKGAAGALTRAQNDRDRNVGDAARKALTAVMKRS